MKKKDNEKTAPMARLSALLEVPLDILADVPRITLNDNRELSIENYKSIESYAPQEIRLRAKQYAIVVCGRDLEISAITDEEILIRGVVSTLTLQ